MTMKVNPFGNRILVKPHEHEGILRDEASLSEYGEVLAVGPEVKNVKVGDTVGFVVFGVEKLIIGEEKHYFINESDEFLLCTIEA